MDHLDIVKRLCDNNCDTYIVGGGIRDMLLGDNPDDYDVVTKATPEQVLELFDDCRVKIVGKSFGVVLVEGYEVATFRHDLYEGKKCKVKFAETIHDDLSRRDLTVNAMAYCELTGEIIDDHGGQKDLEERIVRFVGNPDDRILEDPCRILRACRFIAKIDGTFAPSTLMALRKHSKHLFNYRIAPERIRIEVLKAMKIKKASKFFIALHEIGALSGVFWALENCWDHPHGKYHTENVFEHCMMCGDELPTWDPILKLTGYLHDVGKPMCYLDVDQSFIDHENEGAHKLGIHLKQLTFSLKEIEKICGLVRVHMNPIKEMSDKGIRKLLKRFDDRKVEVDDFLRLRMADRKANLARPNFTLTEWKDMVRKLKYHKEQEPPFNTHALALSGGEIIERFDIPPGPKVSQIQKYLLEYVIMNGKDFNTKELLIKVVWYYIKHYL